MQIARWWTALSLTGLMALAGGVHGATPPRTDCGDTLVYTVEPGDTLVKICGRHRTATNHYSLDDLLGDIRAANRLESNFLRPGQRLLIPVCEERTRTRVTDPVSDGAPVRGIYLTGPACGVSSVLGRIDRFIAAGGNAVVLDAKDIDGAVTFASTHPLASWGTGRSAPYIPSLDDLLDRLRRRDLYVAARLALFLDGSLGVVRPDLALRDEAGAVRSERGCVWLDPANPEVRDYNLALAVELARAGVDEIQFDYVRFPTAGSADDADALAAEASRRRDAVLGFLSAARDSLTPYDVRISADLFGIMAWDRVEDLALTGQDVEAIASLVDVVCPMIYPSHFEPGFEGHARPGEMPAYFIAEGVRRFRDMAGDRAEIRPWLQAFPWRVRGFDADYVAVQIAAADDAGADGWCLWNPSSRYTMAVAALHSPWPGPVPDLAPTDIGGAAVGAMVRTRPQTP